MYTEEQLLNIDDMQTLEIKGGFINITIGDELYVYYGGSLLYKRWLSRGVGRVFHQTGKL